MSSNEQTAATASRAFGGPLSLSLLNDYLFCQRRAYLKLVDGVWGDNEHTVLGTLAHEHVDAPGYEQRAGWELLRALPLFSDKLGLAGKADLVEVRRDPDTGKIVEARAVEYKKGPKRVFDNDDAQLCAQALCLEEMLGISVSEGAVFHAASQHRREVSLDGELRHHTLSALAGLRVMAASETPPVAEPKPQCEGCSLHTLCMPEASNQGPSALFSPRDYR